MSQWRYTYRGPLAEPLKDGEQAADKLPLLYADLGVSMGRAREALLAFAIRHISGFRREGPKTKAYPSGRLRWLLKPHEAPEDKLPDLMQHYGATCEKECLLAAAVVHVQGFKTASVMRTGGPTRTIRKPNEQRIADNFKEIRERNPDMPLASARARAREMEERRVAGINVYQAAADEAQLIEMIDQMREDKDRHMAAFGVKKAKLEVIAYEISRSKPDPTDPTAINPGYGEDPAWIVSLYTNAKRFERQATKRGDAVTTKLAEVHAAQQKRRRDKPDD